MMIFMRILEIMTNGDNGGDQFKCDDPNRVVLIAVMMMMSIMLLVSMVVLDLVIATVVVIIVIFIIILPMIRLEYRIRDNDM